MERRQDWYDGNWVQTYTNRQFWPLDPRPEEVFIEDIAHALSLQCRFTGHVREFYSTAEHCVRVSRVCPPEDALWGLLHDASEAYLNDIARPVKHTKEFDFFRAVEKKIQAAICERFGLPLEEPESVHKADKLLLYTEKRDLMPPRPVTEDRITLLDEIVPWSSGDAETIFLIRFKVLMNERNRKEVRPRENSVSTYTALSA